MLAVLAACGGGGDDGAVDGPTVRTGPPDASTSTYKYTARMFDFAIVGSAMFTLVDPFTHELVYSRQGHFHLDDSGRLVSPEGWQVVGYPRDDYASHFPAIDLPWLDPMPPVPLNVEGRATSHARLGVNVDARTAVWTGGFHLTPIFSVTVMDARGIPIELNLMFTKVGVDEWSVKLNANWVDLAQALTLKFAPDGRPASSGRYRIDIPASTGVDGRATLPIVGVELDLSEVTQFGAPFTRGDTFQDGVQGCKLAAPELRRDGTIYAHCDNGTRALVGQILQARFAATDRLVSKGAHGWTCGEGCVRPVLGAPGLPGINELWLGALEVE